MDRGRVFGLGGLVMVAALVIVAGASAATPTATVFSGQGSGITRSGQEGITAGPDGNVWFTEGNGDGIGVITPNGVASEFNVTQFAKPLGIVSGPDNRLWYALSDRDRIGRIDSNGNNPQEFFLPANSEPNQITVGNDGKLWFTMPGTHQVGAMDPADPTNPTTSGTVNLPAGSVPSGITLGPDGNIWVTLFGTDKIAKIIPVFPGVGILAPGSPFGVGITTGADPARITAGADGNLWFTEFATKKIARITPSGTVTEFSIPGGGQPIGITPGQDGNLWFVTRGGFSGGSGIGRITPTGQITEFPVISGGNSISFGADGNLWASGWDSAFIARMTTALDSPAFTNPNELTIPQAGEASPYPSTIDVSGLNGTVTDVRVRISGISHSFPSDIDALLVGPEGQAVKLISDIGSPQPINGNKNTSAPANGITLNLRDDAPFTLDPDGPIVPGVYKPADGAPDDTFDPPAPGPPYATQLSAFDGTDPNGEWQLFVKDDFRLNAGRITRGWGLDITTVPNRTVTVSVDGPGRVTGPGIDCPGDCSQEFRDGTSVNLTAAPSKGARFDRWGGDCSGTGGCTVQANADKSISAKFTDPAPKTSITKQPERKLRTSKRKAKVKFAFSADEESSFECSMDGADFKACRSPARYRLLPGKHKFAVVAVDEAGNSDPTPATAKVKVKQVG